MTLLGYRIRWIDTGILIDPITEEEFYMTEDKEVETIARIIARRLGHNDDVGMDWERYILPARAIVEHYQSKKPRRVA
jgi:hypothetical protein